MATIVWQGGAASIAQVDTVQITGYDAGTTYKLTVGDKTVSVTGTTDADGTAAALSAAWNLSTEPEVAEITATVATDTVTLTSDTPGTSHIVTSSVAGAAGTMGAVTESVPNSGPNDVAVLTNYSSNTLPGPGDDLVCEHSSVDMLYNLDAMGNIDSFTAKSTYTGFIGLPRNSAEYVEYRPTELALGTAIDDIDIGQGDGDGSSRLKLAIGNQTDALAINVYKTGIPIETGIPSLLITTGTQSNDTTLTVNRGDVGLGFFAGETAVVDLVTLGYITQPLVDAKVTCGSGVTLTQITKSGGHIYFESNVSTFISTGGTAAVGEDATVGVGGETALVDGTLFYSSVGDVDNLEVSDGATIDFRQDARSRTCVNAVVHSGGGIQDPAGTVTWTNNIDLYRCGLPDVNIDIGEHFTLAKSAI